MEILIDLSRNQEVTIFISTHFMNEAERCDRISLMDSGHVLPRIPRAAWSKARGATTLEDAFIGYPRGGDPAALHRTRPTAGQD
ncbi:MAG: hypothetical protein WDN50_12810 [Bradyrhizobium sp.]